MAPEEEIAWAAGLFEGEGCFSSTCEKTPRASMASTDLDVLERFAKIVGCGSIKPTHRKQKAHHKSSWQWYSLNGEFDRVYGMLRKWLSPRRIAAAELAKRIFAEHRRSRICERPCFYCAKPFSPPSIRAGARQRYCSTKCSGAIRRERARARGSVTSTPQSS